MFLESQISACYSYSHNYLKYLVEYTNAPELQSKLIINLKHEVIKYLVEHQGDIKSYAYGKAAELGSQGVIYIFEHHIEMQSYTHEKISQLKTLGLEKANYILEHREEVQSYIYGKSSEVINPVVNYVFERHKEMQSYAYEKIFELKTLGLEIAKYLKESLENIEYNKYVYEFEKFLCEIITAGDSKCDTE